MKLEGLVIAGSYDRFLNWCQENGKDRREYKYVNNAYDVAGYWNIPVHLADGHLETTAYKAAIEYGLLKP